MPLLVSLSIHESLIRVYEANGTKGVLVRGMKKIFSPLARSGSLVFFERDLHQPLPAGRSVENVIAREAFAGDVALFDGMLNAPAYKQAALDRFNRGDRCFVGIDSTTGKLANLRWVTTGTAYIPEIARYIRLKPGEAYIYDMFTLPEYRKRGFDHCVRRLTYNAMAASGIHKVLTYMAGDNFANMRASRSYLTRTGRMWYVQLRGCSLMVFGANRPGVPVLTTGASS